MITGRDRRRALILSGVVVLPALAFLACLPIWQEIASIAIHDPENSHILLAIPVALFLAWLRRARLRRLPAAPSLWGPAMCAVALLFVSIGPTYGFESVSHLGALLLVAGAALSVVGPVPFERFKPAILMLLFLLPVPGRIRHAIALPLQEISARVVAFMLDLLGIPVLRTGNALTVNGVEVAVAEACNGMRMVSALALVTAAFVFSVPMRNSVRLAFVAASPLIALVVNVTRLTPTVLFYGYSDSETADFFHDVSGWGALLVALAVLSGIMALLRWIEVPISPYPVFAGKGSK